MEEGKCFRAHGKEQDGGFPAIGGIGRCLSLRYFSHPRQQQTLNSALVKVTKLKNILSTINVMSEGEMLITFCPQTPGFYSLSLSRLFFDILSFFFAFQTSHVHFFPVRPQLIHKK